MSVEINQQLALLNSRLDEQQNKLHELEGLIYKVVHFLRTESISSSHRFDTIGFTAANGRTNLNAEQLAAKLKGE